ncbi:MAG: hypothetical protein ACI8VC_001069 [Candidatus Endobugula sp.]|jgi:hypothetical protein
MIGGHYSTCFQVNFTGARNKVLSHNIVFIDSALIGNLYKPH